MVPGTDGDALDGNTGAAIGDIVEIAIRDAGRGGDDCAGAAACVLQGTGVVGANHPAARGKRERFHDARKLDADELGTKGTAQVHPPHRRDGKSRCRERRTGQILAPSGSGRGRSVVCKPDGGRGPVRDFHRGVVGGDDPRDGPLAMSADDVRDDRLGVREFDLKPIPHAGDQRVLPFARDEHFDSQFASRLQIGVDPVAAGRGNQQDPGCGVLLRIGNRRDPQPQPPPPAMPHAPQVPAPPVAWNTLLNTKVEPVSRVTKSISAPRR